MCSSGPYLNYWPGVNNTYIKNILKHKIVCLGTKTWLPINWVPCSRSSQNLSLPPTWRLPTGSMLTSLPNTGTCFRRNSSTQSRSGSALVLCFHNNFPLESTVSRNNWFIIQPFTSYIQDLTVEYVHGHNGWNPELVFPTVMLFNSTDLAVVIPNSTIKIYPCYTTTSWKPYHIFILPSFLGRMHNLA